jgi:hypothetical protein
MVYLSVMHAPIGNWQLAIGNVLPQQPAQAWWKHSAEFALHRFVDLPIGFINRRENHVLKHFDVTFFYGFGINLK